MKNTTTASSLRLPRDPKNLKRFQWPQSYLYKGAIYYIQEMKRDQHNWEAKAVVYATRTQPVDFLEIEAR